MQLKTPIDSKKSLDQVVFSEEQTIEDPFTSVDTPRDTQLAQLAELKSSVSTSLLVQQPPFKAPEVSLPYTTAPVPETDRTERTDHVLEELDTVRLEQDNINTNLGTPPSRSSSPMQIPVPIQTMLLKKKLGKTAGFNAKRNAFPSRGKRQDTKNKDKDKEKEKGKESQRSRRPEDTMRSTSPFLSTLPMQATSIDSVMARSFAPSSQMCPSQHLMESSRGSERFKKGEACPGCIICQRQDLTQRSQDGTVIASVEVSNNETAFVDALDHFKKNTESSTLPHRGRNKLLHRSVQNPHHGTQNMAMFLRNNQSSI